MSLKWGERMHTGNENTSGRGILSRKSRRLLWLGVGGLLVLVLVATGMFISGVVLASHQFSDVPTSPASVHSAVEWIVNRAITAGCAPGLYCPGTAVTRAQMAIFLRALGVALTPTILGGGDFGAAVDPDPSPIVCQTADYTPTFPQRALMRAYLSLFSAGAMSTHTRIAFSTNSGVTWGNITAGQPSNIFATAGVDAAGIWYQAAQFVHLDLSSGTTYRFGVKAERRTGAADATDSECLIQVEIGNRNPGSSPLMPPERPR